MIMIFVYWSILLASYFIGSKMRVVADKFSFLGQAMMLAVFLLVFIMGLKMGLDRQVIDNLGVIGLSSFVITVFAVAGSILFIFIARKLCKIDRYGNTEGNEVAKEELLEGDSKGNGVAMKSTLIIVLLVIVGVLIGKLVIADNMPEILDKVTVFASNALTIMLCILIAVIGLDMGISGTVKDNIKNVGFKVLIFPIAIIIGTLLAGGAATLLFGFSIKEGLAICAGFGWYSYAPAVITAAGTNFAVAGAVAFMHNVMRETIGIIFIPLVAKKIGYIESLALPGIGTMDVCMPIVSSACREDTAVYGFISGVLLCLFTSVSVPLIMGI